MAVVTFQEVKTLLHPHYLFNIALAVLYLVLRLVRPFCSTLFPTDSCELDFRETEILTFLAIIVLFRTRKTGVTRAVPYISTACMYTKVANVLLFFYNDPRLGILYAAICLVHMMVLPEPSFQGQDKVVYFSEPDLEEEIQRDKRVVWLVAFYALWNPACVNFAPVFSELASKYTLDNLKFGKVDVTRFPRVAEKYNVNTSTLTRQLPTVLMFKGGKPVVQRPTVDSNSKLVRFPFSYESVVSAFDLNNLYKDCRENPIKKRKMTTDVAQKKDD